MFGSKKEERGRLPDLPSSNVGFDRSSAILPPEPEEDEEFEKNELPTFPDSPSHNAFSRAAIKDAVNSNYEEDESRSKKIVEMEEWSPTTHLSRSQEKLNDEDSDDSSGVISRPRPMVMPRQMIRETGVPDVFIKIDKFHAAKMTFGMVKKKLEEIDELIKKVRDRKLREEQELTAWEQDLVQIKAKIQEVTENVFEKVD